MKNKKAPEGAFKLRISRDLYTQTVDNFSASVHNFSAYFSPQKMLQVLQVPSSAQASVLLRLQP